MMNKMKNHCVQSSGKIANLLLVFLTLVLAGSTSPAPTNKDFTSKESFLRLSFANKLSSLPTLLETYATPSHEGTAFWLNDKSFRASILQSYIATKDKDTSRVYDYSWKDVERGGGLGRFIPAGYNPFGYQITKLGQKFLEFDGSLDSDVGRFLASVRTRKRFDGIKSQWLEILRMSKKGQSMRIYRSLKDLIDFCLAAGFLD